MTTRSCSASAAANDVLQLFWAPQTTMGLFISLPPAFVAGVGAGRPTHRTYRVTVVQPWWVLLYLRRPCGPSEIVGEPAVIGHVRTAYVRTSGHHYLAWAGLSQAVNAGTNLLVTLQLARALPVRDFSAVALGLALLALAVAGLRGYSFEPAVVHGDLSRASAQRMLTDAALTGLGVGTGIVVVVLALSGPADIAAVVAIGAVCAVIQDAARWVLIGLSMWRPAAGLDLLWLAVQLALLVLTNGSASGAALSWTAGAIASALVGWVAVQRSTVAGPSSPARRVWHWGLEYLIASGSIQLAILVAPITGGIEVAGVLRGAASLLGAASVLLGAAQQAVAGRLRAVTDNTALRSLGIRIGILLGVLVAIACLPFLAIGDSLGRQLLGDTWPLTRAVLPILALQRVATAVAAGPAFVLRKKLGQTSGVWWRAGITAVVLLAVLLAADSESSVSAAIPLAGGAVASIPIWMTLLRRATRDSGPSRRV